MSTTKITVYHAIDVPHYAQQEVEVPDELLVTNGNEALQEFLKQKIAQLDRDDELGPYEPEWENATDLRIISAQREDGRGVCSDLAVGGGYYEFASNFILMLHTKDWKMPDLLQTIELAKDCGFTVPWEVEERALAEAKSKA